MPTPYIFQSTQELIESLRSDRTRAAAQAFFANGSATVSDVVIAGVSGNTFRAFRNLPVQPSVAFRGWTTNYLQDSLNDIAHAVTQQSYSAYVHNASLALCEYWRGATNSEMGYGRAAKLLNLVLKKLACLQPLRSEQRSRLIELQHVPLDSYTIVGLRCIATELSIPKNATMKYIQTPQQYSTMQRKIAEITEQAEVPAIYYDVLAWNMAHDGQPRRSSDTPTAGRAKFERQTTAS